MKNALRAPLAIAAALAIQACATGGAPRDYGSAARYLDGGGKVDDRFDVGECMGCTLLHLAAGDGKPEMTRLLLERGADVDATAANGMTPLHLACATQELESAKVLLARHAALDAQDAWGNTPLLRAIGHRKEQDAWVFTPFGAVAGGSGAPAAAGHQLAVMLADAGAGLEVATNKGTTPLHLAAFLGHGDTVKLLLERGVDRARKNAQGQTALDLARAAHRDEVVRLLLAKP